MSCTFCVVVRVDISFFVFINIATNLATNHATNATYFCWLVPLLKIPNVPSRSILSPIGSYLMNYFAINFYYTISAATNIPAMIVQIVQHAIKLKYAFIFKTKIQKTFSASTQM
mmetsp:Transcript_29918/g.45582  ORF Transcript_29918/g.45582 Transcript_29918/m.45582 type:complete len:114 (+) Transcript_29918:77-418(+)